MTAEGVAPPSSMHCHRFNFQTAKQFQTRVYAPRRDAPESCIYLPPHEGVGNAGCPLHPRSRVHFVLVERTRATTSTPESPGIPARNGFTVYFALSPVTGLFCHRRPRIWFACAR